MPSRIIVGFRDGESDPLGSSLEKTIRNFLGINAESVRTRRVYTIYADLGREEIESLEKDLFVDPVTECSVRDIDGRFDWLIEVEYKPGVTNPVGKTAAEAVSRMVNKEIDIEGGVSTSLQYLISGIGRGEAQAIAARLLSNQVIENARVLGREEIGADGIPILQQDMGMEHRPEVKAVDLAVSDEKLMEISRNGVLALSLAEMKVIQKYSQYGSVIKERESIGMDSQFLGKLTDVELEVVAQTQSEHCKHKIFNGIVNYAEQNGVVEVIDGLFGTCIKAPARELMGRYKWIISAFDDNAGIVDVGGGIVVADKIETHNAPSALDPYGGAITGILGVNRDILGAGIGARPMFNVFGYCFGDPFHSKALMGGVLHPARIRNGVHRGVIDGGNQSGIALMDGFEVFDERFGFRPLVYCGTIGTMPKTVNARQSDLKKAMPGDLAVMVGGRIGKDGIHGATFSSAELNKDSPVQAVQIGDSITQKKMLDFLIEARDRGLYSSITDNGAGGLSSSIGEMAKDTNGCIIDLKKAPLKYRGLMPWEIIVSESQERMTVAVDPSKIGEFTELAGLRGVEATALGRFTDSGRFHAMYGDMTVAYLDMDFMHKGFPRMELVARWKEVAREEPRFLQPKDLGSVMECMLARLNICSKEYKMRQYDHEVKGLSIVKPFVGKQADVSSDATVALLGYARKDGLVVSHGINPHYSDIDTYWMAASVIDEAIRRAIATGCKLPDEDNIMYALDNFCWNLSSLDSDDGHFKMAQLVRANKALAEYCRAFKVPCISGKDSMKNVWRGEETIDGKTVEKTISIPPTLLFSVRARIEDVSKAVTMDVKNDGDAVYILGETYDELGASEYFAYVGEKAAEKMVGNNVPKVDAVKAIKTYSALSAAIEKGLVSSAHTPTLGGLGVAMAQSAFAGGYGIEADLRKVPYLGERRDDYILFSQSNSRFIVTVPSTKCSEFEGMMDGTAYARIGTVTRSTRLKVTGLGGTVVIDSDIQALKESWKGTLEGM
jgi:phosphoribosylformylglycinamidine synthase